MGVSSALFRPSARVAARSMAGGVVADMEEDEVVLGIPMTDPGVLKATQFVMSAVGVTAYFLVMDLIEIADLKSFYLGAQTTFHTAFKAIGLTRAVLLVFTGYFGIKWSNVCLIGSFVALSLFGFLEMVVVGGYFAYLHEDVGSVLLCCFEAAFFLVAVHYSYFLFSEARVGSLQKARPSKNSLEYTLLGIPVMDMKVLKATQRLFTSIGIIGSILGFQVLLSAETVVKDMSSSGFWFVTITIVLSLGLSGYYGVKRSNYNLLSLFCCITIGLLAFSILTSLLSFIACIVFESKGCISVLSFLISFMLVLLLAIKNALYLRDKAVMGTILASPVATQQGVSATQIGAGCELPEKVADPKVSDDCA